MSEPLLASRDALAARLAPRLAAPASEWLGTARADVSRDPATLARSFPAAARKVGREPLLDPVPREAVRLQGNEGPILNPWRLDEAARAVLFLEDALRDPSGAGERARSLYFQGE